MKERGWCNSCRILIMINVLFFLLALHFLYYFAFLSTPWLVFVVLSLSTPSSCHLFHSLIHGFLSWWHLLLNSFLLLDDRIESSPPSWYLPAINIMFICHSFTDDLTGNNRNINIINSGHSWSCMSFLWILQVFLQSWSRRVSWAIIKYRILYWREQTGLPFPSLCWCSWIWKQRWVSTRGYKHFSFPLPVLLHALFIHTLLSSLKETQQRQNVFSSSNTSIPWEHFRSKELCFNTTSCCEIWSRWRWKKQVRDPSYVVSLLFLRLLFVTEKLRRKRSREVNKKTGRGRITPE